MSVWSRFPRVGSGSLEWGVGGSLEWGVVGCNQGDGMELFVLFCSVQFSASVEGASVEGASLRGVFNTSLKRVSLDRWIVRNKDGSMELFV